MTAPTTHASPTGTAPVVPVVSVVSVQLQWHRCRGGAGQVGLGEGGAGLGESAD